MVFLHEEGIDRAATERAREGEQSCKSYLSMDECACVYIYMSTDSAEEVSHHRLVMVVLEMFVC